MGSRHGGGRRVPFMDNSGNRLSGRSSNGSLMHETPGSERMDLLMDALSETSRSDVKDLVRLPLAPHSKQDMCRAIQATVLRTLQNVETDEIDLDPILRANPGIKQSDRWVVPARRRLRAVILGASGAVGRCLVAQLLQMEHYSKVISVSTSELHM